MSRFFFKTQPNLESGKALPAFVPKAQPCQRTPKLIGATGRNFKELQQHT